MLLIAVSSCWGDGKEKEASEQAQSKEQVRRKKPVSKHNLKSSPALQEWNPRFR